MANSGTTDIAPVSTVGTHISDSVSATVNNEVKIKVGVGAFKSLREAIDIVVFVVCGIPLGDEVTRV